MKETLLHNSSCINSNNFTPKYEKLINLLLSKIMKQNYRFAKKKTVDKIVYLCAFDELKTATMLFETWNFFMHLTIDVLLGGKGNEHVFCIAYTLN